MISSPNMDYSFATYPAFIEKSLSGLSFEKLLFFQVWIAEYLYHQFGEELNARFLEEEGIDLKEVLEFLWYIVDKANKEGKNEVAGQMSLMDEELLTKYIDSFKNESIFAELDENETNESGMANLLNAFYNALFFIRKKELRYAAEAAIYPLNVVDRILANDYGLDTRDPDEHVGHPLFRAEFIAQTRLLDYLHSGQETGKDKRGLFR
jgi:hypothetical protein